MVTTSDPAPEAVDAEVDPVEEPETDEKTARSRRESLLPGVLAVALVALLVTSAVLWVHQRQTLDAAPVAVAREEARNFFSLDYRTAQDDVDRVLALATGDFKEQYAARSAEVVEGVTTKQLVVTATIPDDGAAVEYLRGDRAQVLVAVDVTSKQGTDQPESSRYRTRIKLSRVDGDWLVSDVQQVG